MRRLWWWLFGWKLVRRHDLAWVGVPHSWDTKYCRVCLRTMPHLPSECAGPPTL